MQSVSSDSELVYLKELVMHILRVKVKGSSAHSWDSASDTHAIMQFMLISLVAGYYKL